MGMPAIFYRLVYGAHSVKSLERNILRFVGIKPVHVTYIGGVGRGAGRSIERLRELGRLGS